MKFISVLILSLVIMFAENSRAGGYDYNTTFGTRTFTLNGLYFAGSPGLSSVYSNPAGLGLLNGFALEVSALNRIETNEFDSPDRGFYKSYSNENYSFGGGAYWKINEILTIGAAYHPLIDYRVDWPFVVLRGGEIRAFSMMNRLEINSISPAVAVQLGPLYIGIAGNVYQAVNQVNFPRENSIGGDTLGMSDYQFEYDLDAWAYGGILGMLYNLNDILRIGVTARSGFKVDFEGAAESTLFSDVLSASPVSDVSSEIEIPWKFGIGFLYSLNDNTTLNLDFSYSLWGSSKEQREFVFDDPVWQNGTSAVDSISGISSNSITLSFNNTIDAGIGFEHSTESGLIFRGGYRFSQSPGSVTSFNYLFPTGDQNILSAGIGYRDGNLIIDAAIAYSFGITKTIERSDNMYLFGEYYTDGYIPSVTLRYEF